jgi:hypothetical protein
MTNVACFAVKLIAGSLAQMPLISARRAVSATVSAESLANLNSQIEVFERVAEHRLKLRAAFDGETRNGIAITSRSS